VHLTDDEQRQYDRLSRELRTFMLERRKIDPEFQGRSFVPKSVRPPDSRRAMRRPGTSRRRSENRAERKFRVIEDLFRLHAGEAVSGFLRAQMPWPATLRCDL